jgi:hypothetical protein
MLSGDWPCVNLNARNLMLYLSDGSDLDRTSIGAQACLITILWNGQLSRLFAQDTTKRYEPGS